MNDEARARRSHAINETLIGLMGQRIKSEVNKMIGAGVSVEQVNETLPHIVFFWDAWREEMLQRCMTEFDDDHERPRQADDDTSVRPN